jgi:hypothetical protein
VAGAAAYDGGALSMRFAATFAIVSCLAAIVAAPAGAQIPPPAPIAIDAPQPGVAVFAQRLDRRRLTAVVELAGRAAPDAQLALSGACGRVSCEGMTFTDANERRRTRMASCCGGDWAREYARRARGMMRFYARGRRRDGVLAAAARAARRELQGGLRSGEPRVARGGPVLPGRGARRRPGATFTPGGRFRQTIRWEGRTVSVRQEDGEHLNVAGASIATTLIIRRMRRDGLIA